MSPSPTPHDVIFFESPAALQAWFDDNYASVPELWVGYHKKATGRPSLTWSEAVDEALCVGWIDGVRYSLDEASHAQRFTPRRKGSTWSAVNVAKVATLVAAGRMRPAGLAAFDERTPERTAIYSYERATAALSDEEVDRLRSNEAAWADWEARPPSYRKAATHWVVSAKQDATRVRRLDTLIADSAAGRTVRPLTPPAKR